MSHKEWDHFRPEDVFYFTESILLANNYPEEAARSIAFVLVEADKRGIFSHGVTGLTGLNEAIVRKGVHSGVNPSSKPTFKSEKYPTLMVANANSCPGPLAAACAIDHLKPKARQLGLARVLMNNANHFGAAGIWSRKIAEDYDLIGIVTCTTAPCVRPLGDDFEGLDYTKGAGEELRTGTNPIAISIPYENGIMTLDMALTRLALSSSISAYIRAQMITIPEYIADKEYKSTYDPKDLIGSSGLIGSVFPLGSTLSGYKGDVLLRMIELLHSYGGGPIRKVNTSSSDPEERVSHSYEAQAIDYLYSKQEALERVRSLISDYQDNYFGTASRWPGDRADQAKSYSEREGIPYDQIQLDSLRRIAKQHNVDFTSYLPVVSKKAIPPNIFTK